MNDSERKGLLLLGAAVAYLEAAGWESEQISDFVLQGADYCNRLQQKSEQKQTGE